jgi:hypothetical protein
MARRTALRPLAAPLAFLAVARAATAQAPCHWNDAASGPVARLEAPSLEVDGRMLVFGGFQVGLKATPRVHAYDPASDSWSTLAAMPSAVTHAGIALDERTVWVAGGFVGDHPGPVTSAVWSYDVDLDQWQARPSLPAPRGSGGLFVIARELHFVGGVDVDRNTDMPEHWVLDLDNPTGWSVSVPLPVARNHFGCASLGDRGYVLGGQFGHDIAPIDVALVHAWDPQQGWLELAPLPFPRSHFEPGTDVHAGRILIAGGRANVMGWPTLPEILAYDPAADAWSLVGLLPQALIAPAFKVLGGEFVLSAGGVTDQSPIAATLRRPASVEPLDALRLDLGGDGVAGVPAWCEGAGEYGGVDYSNPSVVDIALTELDALYRTARTGSDADPTYAGARLPASDGAHVVRLHFAEIYWGAPGGPAGGVGKRVFDVRAEGQLLLDDLDLTAAAGVATALVHSAVVEVAGPQLELDLSASVDRPLLAALALLPVDDDGSYCVGAPNSAGHGARMGRAGSPSIAENDLWLVARAVPPNAPGLFLESSTTAQIPLFAGFLCVGSPFTRLLPGNAADANGSALHSLELQAATPGETRHYQYWYRDAALTTSNFSDGLTLTFAP